MATKKPAAKTAAAPAQAPKTVAAPAAAPAAPKKEAKVPLAKMRGPRGVPETAKISILTDNKANPKRPNSKAHAVFSLYKEGMTVGKFCDAVDATDNKGAATPNLVYDSKHGFIAIEGYDPGEIIKAKPKAEKPEKKDTAPKGPAVAKTAKASKADKEAKEETVD